MLIKVFGKELIEFKSTSTRTIPNIDQLMDAWDNISGAR